MSVSRLDAHVPSSVVCDQGPCKVSHMEQVCEPESEHELPCSFALVWVLFERVEDRKPPKGPSAGGWADKRWSVHKMKEHSVLASAARPIKSEGYREK